MPGDVDRFIELNREFPLRPIRSGEGLNVATRRVGELLDVDRTPAEDDYLSVLSGLVQDYVDESNPMPDVSAEDMLRHLIESRGMTQRELAAGCGIHEATISKILRGHWSLNLRHIRAISKFLGVEPGLFV